MTALPTDDLAPADRRIQELTKELSQARGELSQAKGELAEAREQQTATNEILRVISSSPSQVYQVFETIIERAVKLCGGVMGGVFRLDRELIHFVAGHGISGQALEAFQRAYPRPLSRDKLLAPVLLEGRPLNVPDVREQVRNVIGQVEIGHRGTVYVPILRDGKAIGAIAVGRREAGTFPDDQVLLLKTFADQAVIAIENARLFEELQASTRDLTEALEQQTATADVLKVISRSALDVQKVLDALVESAARLCDADDAAIFQVFGNSLRLVAHHGRISTIGPVGQLTIPLERGSIGAHAVIDRRTIHVADMLAEGEYPESRQRALQLGYRTVLAVPLVHAGEAIGFILIRRIEVRPFTGRQIELVNTFADQAVIAIENTRLFEAEQASKRELQVSLEYQTATSEVLGVISRSPSDLKPVLLAIAETAGRLCGTNDVGILLRENDQLRFTVNRGSMASLSHVLPLERVSVSGRTVTDGVPIHVHDLQAAEREYPLGYEIAKRHGHRTALGIPLMRDGSAIGCIFLRHTVIRPFTNRQIALLQTFADQAVIAIENTRLFEEVQARTRELAKTIEDLEIASQHKNQFVANMSHELRTPLAAILGYAELIQEGFYEPQGPKSLDALTRICSNGKHLLGLINTVLDIAKIESGQFTLNMSEYAIESVVETVRAATESLAQNKKLALTTSVDKSLPVGLGDEQRLTQVLLNLVGNAIKFTDAGEVSIAARARDGRFAVSVTDTGPGIPLDQQDRIFEQFHQVDSSNTKAKGGTGLGLAIAKQIVELHGGQIWVESTPGKGSKFQMELPTRAEFRKLAPGGAA
jgi:signal transduction histidine kinase